MEYFSSSLSILLLYAIYFTPISTQSKILEFRWDTFPFPFTRSFASVPYDLSSFLTYLPLRTADPHSPVRNGFSVYVICTRWIDCPDINLDTHIS